MNVNNNKSNDIERIVYRFSRKEISALLKLMSIARLPGTTVEAEQPEDATIWGLIDGGVVMPCGEHTFVDATTSLILMTAGQSSRYLSVQTPEARVVLYSGEELCVLVEETGWNVLKIEPLQNMESALKPLMTAVEALGEAAELTLADGEETISRPGGVKNVEELFFMLRKQ